MVDEKTFSEWEKSKRIEEAKMKATKNLNENSSLNAGIEYLDPKSTKVKGWSNNTSVISASIERMSNISIVLVLCGAVLSIIGFAGGTVTNTFNLGMAGVLISALPEGVGTLCLVVGLLMAVISLVSEIVRKIKNRQKLSSAFATSIGTILAVALYVLVRWLLIRFS